jgi:hypothetical protein
MIAVYVVEGGRLQGALVRHGQSKGIVVLLPSVEVEWMQDVVQGQLHV